MYIHEHSNWPNFTFNQDRLFSLLEMCHYEQGRLLSRIDVLGLSEKEDKILSCVSEDIIKSSEIEGILLNSDQVRSSIARRLGIDRAGLVPASRNVEAVVDMMLDAANHYELELTEKRLFGWHASLFPSGYSGIGKIDIGKYRQGPMYVISGSMGNEKVHFEAPAPDRILHEMDDFLSWINTYSGDSYIKAAIAHLWFVTIHPFDDGNGRIARTISDMLICRSDRTQLRFYSLSGQIMADKASYYDVLERSQKGNLDITEWIEWFLNRVLMAIRQSLAQTESVVHKYNYLNSIEKIPLNDRQRLMIAKLVSGIWVGALNTSKWAKIAKCSSDTALRDINDLIEKGILEKNLNANGRSTNYILASRS